MIQVYLRKQKKYLKLLKMHESELSLFQRQENLWINFYVKK